MKLRTYLVLHGPPNRRLGMTHPIIKQIAAAAGVSRQQVYKISLGRVYASPAVAEVINTITRGRVKPKETINARPKKPGRKPSPESVKRRRAKRRSLAAGHRPPQ